MVQWPRRLNFRLQASAFSLYLAGRRPVVPYLWFCCSLLCFVFERLGPHLVVGHFLLTPFDLVEVCCFCFFSSLIEVVYSSFF